MKTLISFIFKFKRSITFVVVLILVLSVYQITKLESNNDMVSFLSHNDPDVILLNETGEKFGSNYIIMLAIETDNIFTYKNLNLIKNITEDLEKMEGIEHVVSLTNILDIKKIEDGLEVSQLIDKDNIPERAIDLAKLKSYVLSKQMYNGTIINNRGNTALIIVRMRTTSDKELISEKSEKIVNDAISKMKNTKAYFSGLPMWMYQANKLMMNDLSFLTPLVALLIIIILYLSFRSFRGVVLPFTTVLLSTAFALGIMSMVEIELTLLSAVLPVILLSTGTAYGIHLLNADREVTLMGSKIPGRKIDLALNKVGMAIFLSALTTMFGFSSLITANIIPIREFGVFVALGILYALLITLCFLPTIIEVWSYKKIVKINKNPDKKTIKSKDTVDRRFLTGLAKLSFKHSKKIILIAFVVIVASIFLIPGIETEVNMSKYFDEDSTIRQAENLLEREFAGSNPVVVDFRTSNIKHPAVLRLMQRLQKRLRATEHIKNLQSVTDYMMEMNNIMNNHRVTPNTIEGVENLWLFIEGKKELNQVVGEYKKEAIIQGIVDSSNSKVLNSVTKEVTKILRSTPRKWTLIKRSSVNEKLIPVFAKNHVQFVLEEIVDDLSYAGIKISNRDQLHIELTEKVIADSAPKKYAYKKVRDALIKYLSSDVAEIPFESEKDIKAIADGIMNLNFWQSEDVKKIVSKRAPRWILEEDPLAVDDLADSLKARWDTARKEAKVDWMWDSITANVAPKLDTAEKIVIERLKGDLWELTEDITWIPVEKYKDSMSKEPVDTVEVDLFQTGSVKITSNILRRLIQSVFESLGIALTLVLILLSIQFKSLTGGLISMIPIVFTILCNFCVMSIFGIPLDVATAMIAGVAIGIGIDYTIHIKTRFKKEITELKDIKKALYTTVTTTGRAVIINTFAVMMGFIVLLFSEFEPIRRFGYLTALTMLISGFGAITLFSSVVLVTKPKFLMKNNENNISNKKQ